MKITDFLAPSDVACNLRAADKTALLRELAGRAAAALGLPAEAIAAELEKREELGSTGIGGGVSIPHARLREARKPYGFFARLKGPIDFNAIDGQPVDLVFLLILPASSQLDQLNALAAVARRLRQPEVLQRLRKAADAADLHRAITA